MYRRSGGYERVRATDLSGWSRFDSTIDVTASASYFSDEVSIPIYDTNRNSSLGEGLKMPDGSSGNIK
jgi:hypothetical protein